MQAGGTDRIDLSGFVKETKDGGRRLDFAIEGITCAACIGEIETAMQPLAGVTRARLNYTTRRLALEWRDLAFDPAQAVDTLRRMGYRAHPFECAPAEAEEAKNAKLLLRCLAVAGFAAMNVMLLSVSVWAGNVSDIDAPTRDMFHWISALIALPAAAFAGQPFFASAAGALKRKSLNMDVPISLGVVLALGMSLVETARHAAEAYFDSALMLLFFLLLGRYLDNAMRQKTRAVAGNLAALRAPLAFRLKGEDDGVLVPTSSLVKGDLVLVKPGERISADGVVVAGTSEIDESLVTGETRRRDIGPGDCVYAGTLNFTGALRINVMAAGAGTLLDEIERLVETASAAKSRYVRLADRASRLYAPVVHLTALATALGWLIAGASLHDAIITAIAVLIITCPCALALAVPAVQVVSSGSLFRAGVLLNAGDAIERLAEVDTIVFDKTGTLTLPEARVVNEADVPADLLALAIWLAQASHHPLARALARTRLERGAPQNLEIHETPGQGVAAMIDGIEARLGSATFCDAVAETSVALAGDPEASAIVVRHGARHAVLLVRQALRADAATVIDGLRRAGYAIEIVSGDRREAVAAAAAALGNVPARGGLSPVEKVARLDALRAEGRRVLMVGDGLNDAPALASAHVSLSPITAADVTQAAADAVFLGDGLAPVAACLSTARVARRLMRQNLQIAIAYNLVAVPLAMSGALTPLIAALAMSGSSLVVTLNALRAGRVGAAP